MASTHGYKAEVDWAASAPEEILVKIFVFVGAPKDICSCSLVCRAFQRSTSSSILWQELAHLKFGQLLAANTAGLYNDNWKRMMMDDNKKGALPTLENDIVCNWKPNNSQGHYYCCIVTAVKWHRELKELRVYLDVRGERDLRHPIGSSVTRRIDGRQANGSATATRFLSELTDTFSEEHPAVLQRRHRPADLQRHHRAFGDRRRHYKGYLSFPEHLFEVSGQYFFCYACRDHADGDYESVCIFSVPYGGFERAFDAYSSETTPRICYKTDISPFADDTPETANDRWTRAVPQKVMQRRDWYADP
jgi:hypothetical protein